MKALIIIAIVAIIGFMAWKWASKTNYPKQGLGGGNSVPDKDNDKGKNQKQPKS